MLQVTKEMITTYTPHILGISKHGLFPSPMEDFSDCLPPKSWKVQSRKPLGLQALRLTYFILKTLKKLLDLHIINDVG